MLPLVNKQHELDNLIQQHKTCLNFATASAARLPRCVETASSWNNVRLLADKIEDFSRNLKKLEQKTADEECESVQKNQETGAYSKLGQLIQLPLPTAEGISREPDSEEKLAFLSIFNIEPRYLHDALPTHRKSKRKPAPKVVAYNPVDPRTGQPPKKRVLRKTRPPENDQPPVSASLPRPSSVPATIAADSSHVSLEIDQSARHSDKPRPTVGLVQSSAHLDGHPPPSANRPKATLAPNRFITQTVVRCTSCNEPFTVHQVDGAWGGALSPKTDPLCFVCQMSSVEDDRT